ncbi:MAG: DUF1501 domain-containing protein [Myxococcales bacterium]|nr:DUF1501 domain-containing protein [Myxococcales bacterium]
MDRRKFLELASLSGLAVAAPSAYALLRDREARARAAAPYRGPFWLLINAGGGWDPIYCCDPKTDGEQNRLYTSIASAGEIKYAPIDPAHVFDAYSIAPEDQQYFMTNQTFFERYASKLLVVNGVDTSTNNHESGSRSIWSGRVLEGYPSLGALLAASKAPEGAMAFLSGGGHDNTAGIIPLTRAASASALGRLLHPGLVDPAKPDGDRYHSAQTSDRIARAQQERLKRLRGVQHLPHAERQMDALYLARGSDADLARLSLPTLVDLPPAAGGDLERMCQQAQIAVSAFKAGVAVACNLHLGGFDTHATHDRNQVRQLCKLFYGIDFVMNEVQQAGLGDNVVVMIGSDFGRGPAFNGVGDGSGKDHWPITSVMFMGKGVRGNRVIGGTDGEQRALHIDKASKRIDSGGVKITTQLVHRAVRRFAGIEGGALSKQYPLVGEDVDLFG